MLCLTNTYIHVSIQMYTIFGYNACVNVNSWGVSPQATQGNLTGFSHSNQGTSLFLFCMDVFWHDSDIISGRIMSLRVGIMKAFYQWNVWRFQTTNIEFCQNLLGLFVCVCWGGVGRYISTYACTVKSVI